MNKYRIHMSKSEVVAEIENLRKNGSWGINELNSKEGKERIKKIKRLMYLLNREEILKRQATTKKLTKQGKRKPGDFSAAKVPYQNTKLLTPLKPIKPLKPLVLSKKSKKLKKAQRELIKEKDRIAHREAFARKKEKNLAKFLEEFNKKFPD